MTGGSVSPAEVRSVLRTVLRAVDRHLTPASGSQLWRQEVLSRFRAGAAGAAGAPGAGASPASASAPASAAAADPQQPGPSGRGPPGAFDRSALPIAPAGRAPTPAQALAAAREWAELANNIARHKELLLSYNIGLDVDERTKRMVEATARRVGFALPAPKEDVQTPAQRQAADARKVAAMGKAAAAREEEASGFGASGGRGDGR
ncbi:hypothetical protein HXX76_002889 [Chlamydomonas incerta]|uniref:Uncharacterized protein n=1 Tax=Chlamydomonas incerta TaxID=51695 RepID=A0A835W7X5_CHLIN|nr:hypothetical protein HXX76_002889 [Chlamydomonas incerta]|eukprot:KAG2442810.1 hypothetical protein HXX76_002889 [Chlamydomonas incerta]